MKPIVSARERAWRNRNPSLAVKFDRLSAGTKANIRTNGFGKGTAELTRLADSYRRQDVKVRSKRRRVIEKIRSKVRATQGGHRPHDFDDTDFSESEFWDVYDQMSG